MAERGTWTFIDRCSVTCTTVLSQALRFAGGVPSSLFRQIPPEARIDVDVCGSQECQMQVKIAHPTAHPRVYFWYLK